MEMVLLNVNINMLVHRRYCSCPDACPHDPPCIGPIEAILSTKCSPLRSTSTLRTANVSRGFARRTAAGGTSGARATWSLCPMGDSSFGTTSAFRFGWKSPLISSICNANLKTREFRGKNIRIFDHARDVCTATMGSYFRNVNCLETPYQRRS